MNLLQESAVLWGPVMLVTGPAIPDRFQPLRTAVIFLGAAGTAYAAYAAYRKSVL